MTTKRMIRIALMAAVICIFAPLSIPIPVSPVPISLTNLVLLVTVAIFPWKDVCTSYLIYLLLGVVGLPVFSGFSGGIGALLGPTGGYLIGFIFISIIPGLFIDHFPGKRLFTVIGMIIAMIITYTFGTAWLAIQMKMTFFAALAIGVIPYIIGDIVKIIIAIAIGPSVKKRIARYL